MSKPVTRTPSTIRAPASFAFAARPCIDAMLLAKPPLCSCSATCTPCARQSGNMLVMWARTSSSPTIRSDG